MLSRGRRNARAEALITWLSHKGDVIDKLLSNGTIINNSFILFRFAADLVTLHLYFSVLFCDCFLSEIISYVPILFAFRKPAESTECNYLIEIFKINRFSILKISTESGASL